MPTTATKLDRFIVETETDCAYVSGGEFGDATHRISKLLQKGDGNTKLRKNSKIIPSFGLSMLAARHGNTPNVCPHASAGCAAACLDHQGLAGVFESIQRARLARKVLYFAAREWFIDKLSREISALWTRRQRDGLAIRLNVFSDIPWEKVAPSIFADFPNVQFYDYTKNPRRAGLLRPNYWVTFSRSETNEAQAVEQLRRGNNVAVVFDTGTVSNATARGLNPYGLPKTWRGFPVIDGDETDARFDDERGKTRGRVVGLLLKAGSNAERDIAVNSGFAVRGRKRENA